MARIFQRKPDGVYWIDYVVEGKRIRESTGTANKRLAEKCLQSRLGEVVQGKYKLEDRKPSPFFKDFCVQYLQWARENKRSAERDRYSFLHLKPFFGHRRLQEIHPFHVESYKMKRKAEVKPATVNRETALLKRMLNLAVQWNLLQENLIAKVKMFRESPYIERSLTQEEAEKLVLACKGIFKAIVTTALHTGMRRGEILGLKWKDVDMCKEVITLTRTKNNEVRFTPLDRTMRDMLSSLPVISDYVFAQPNGKPYSWIGRVWLNAKSKAGVQCRFHDLRHTFASHLVQNNINLMTVKELLGHKSLRMVERYAHLSDAHKRKAIETLDRSLGVEDGTFKAHGSEKDFIKKCVND